MVSTQAHASIESGLNDASQHQRIIDETTAKLEKAVKWGIPNLICFSGNRGGRNDFASIATINEGLAKLASLAEQAGVNLVLELLNSKVDHPDYQCDTTPFGVACVAPVNSPRIKLLYDAYHMQIMEGDLIRTVQRYHQHFGHYHIAGNPGRNDPDDTQEIHHPPLMRAIAASGYDGFVGHDYPRRQRCRHSRRGHLLLIGRHSSATKSPPGTVTANSASSFIGVRTVYQRLVASGTHA
jgi:hydroxypyruvate isomerase